jgi:DNA helicase-2/ATP-dependent DNA helicase PcrA|tara:strand:- start:8025 stop:8234 length:210 start_codon:yes stop_codon:yes gene_type:complete
MPIELDKQRKAILDAEGHILVLGGPGSGKTTIALLKAKSLFPHLQPGQKLLFLGIRIKWLMGLPAPSNP